MENQLLCSNLCPGDLMLKAEQKDKFVNKVIRWKQRRKGELNPYIVHAGVMFDRTFIIEASGGGIHASDLRIQNRECGYIVYRPGALNLARGAATCAKLMFDIHKTHGGLKYSLMGAVQSLNYARPEPAKTAAEMDLLLDRILAGRTHRFFCSQFAVYVYQFVAEQNGIRGGHLFNMNDAKVPPSRLAAVLQMNPWFNEVGYVMPNER